MAPLVPQAPRASLQGPHCEDEARDLELEESDASFGASKGEWPSGLHCGCREQNDHDATDISNDLLINMSQALIMCWALCQGLYEAGTVVFLISPVRKVKFTEFAQGHAQLVVKPGPARGSLTPKLVKLLGHKEPESRVGCDLSTRVQERAVAPPWVSLCRWAGRGWPGLFPWLRLQEFIIQGQGSRKGQSSPTSRICRPLWEEEMARRP